MGIKIPVYEADNLTKREMHIAPTGQVAEFTEYRDFMGAYCAARLWWLEECASSETDPALRFWFSARDRSVVCYALLRSWNTGYWPTRGELAYASKNVTTASFSRVLRDAEAKGFLVSECDPADRRTRIVKPTRQTITALERATTHYFMELLEAAPPNSAFAKGLRERIARILSLEKIREKFGFTLRK